MNTIIDLTYDEWVEQYKPICDFDGSPIAYETYGEDIDIIRKFDPEFIWTWIDGGDYSVISNGISYVNRMNYYICTVPYDLDVTIQVDIYEMTLCDMDEHVWVDHKRYDGTTVIICSECEMDKEDDNES
jgi:hypothetical protein